MTEVYKTLDGRDFAVDWPDPNDADFRWYWDPEHNPHPSTPLDRSAWVLSRRAAFAARLEAGYPTSDPFGRTLSLHGFSYYAEVSTGPRYRQAVQEASQRLLEHYGGVLQVWEGWCVPRIEARCQMLRKATADTPVERMISDFGFAFEQTFLWFFGGPLDQLRSFCAREFGDQADRICLDLTHGHPTATMDADEALWQLSASAKQAPALREAVVGVPSVAELRSSPVATEFVAALDAYLDRYGWRTEGWDPSSRTWHEHPDTALTSIQRSIVEDRPSPAAAVAEGARRREATTRECLELLAADPEKAQAFRTLVQGARDYLAVREGRAMWQLTLGGLLGAGFRKHGARLVEQGRLDEVDDVFYLDADELNDPDPEADLKALTGERRRERQRWMGVVPPAYIGRGAPADVEFREFPPMSMNAGAVLRGIAASRGRHTGTARVILDMDDAARLAPGDVLVCVTTTPTWTSLFGIAGALVTDGGGMLSHSAIAAREYGIPAVVGSRLATSAIRDGQRVTVDGGTGEVTVEDS